MGLAVEVGVLADLVQHDQEGAQWMRENLEAVNSVLAENGLPAHREPEEMPKLDDRTIVGSFPYSFLHYLRRAYARWKQFPDQPICPCAEDEDPSLDPAIDEESCMFDSHLLCHSDCEGFYFPVRFDEVIIDQQDEGRIPGGLLGSSYQLLDELTRMASALDIELQDGHLSPEAVGRIRDNIDSESELWIERCVWLTLFEAARLSIQHNTAICFH